MTRALLGGALLAAGLSCAASAADFHRIFEQRCTGCHGHAGDFARTSLTDSDGELRGVKSGREVSVLLGRHAGGLSPEEIALFVEVFIRQIAADGFYRDRCDICHDRAYDLARLRLIMRDGRLVGRYSGRDIEDFLRGHARMTADEASEMLEALTALLQGRR